MVNPVLDGSLVFTDEEMRVLECRGFVKMLVSRLFPILINLLRFGGRYQDINETIQKIYQLKCPGRCRLFFIALYQEMLVESIDKEVIRDL